MSEMSFEQMLEESFKTIRNGEVVEGTVIDVKPDEIVLNQHKKMRLAKRLAFLGFDLIFGIVKGEQPLTRRGESGVQR